RLGSQQFRIVGKALKGFIGPELGFTVLSQFNQHSHLACPGGGIVWIEFQDLGVHPKTGLEISSLKSPTSFTGVEIEVFDLIPAEERLLLEIAPKLQVPKAAHIATFPARRQIKAQRNNMRASWLEIIARDNEIIHFISQTVRQTMFASVTKYLTQSNT